MNELLTKLWSFIEKNRWAAIMPFLGLMLWLVASFSCTPLTESPIRQGVQVNAIELQQDYQTWLSDCNLVSQKFGWAVADIKLQEEKWSKVEAAIMTIATGGATTWPSLIQLLMGSGLVGLFADNVRKNGVIGGLKRNKTPI